MPSLEKLRVLLAADPTDSFLRYGIAMELAKQKEFDHALAEFAELTRLHPDYVAAYFMAGRTAEQKGDANRAKTLYQQGIAAGNRTGDAHAVKEITEALAMLG